MAGRLGSARDVGRMRSSVEVARSLVRRFKTMELRDARVHTTLPCADLERAKAFYTEQLGLTPTALMPNQAFFEFLGGSRLVIFGAASSASGEYTQLSFTVDDAEATVGLLKGRGVVFEEYDLPDYKTVNSVATTPVKKAAFFKDSEGNLLSIVQFL